MLTPIDGRGVGVEGVRAEREAYLYTFNTQFYTHFTSNWKAMKRSALSTLVLISKNRCASFSLPPSPHLTESEAA